MTNLTETGININIPLNESQEKPKPNGGDLVTELFPGAYLEKTDPLANPLAKPETLLESPKVWWEKRLENRFYPILYREKVDYLVSKEKHLDRVKRLHKSISDIESKDFDNNQELMSSYIHILNDQVYPVFIGEDINVMFDYDTFADRTSGAHVHYMNELLIPTLQSMEQRFSNVSNESKHKAMTALMDFAKEKFNTNHSAFDTHRYEIAVSMIKIGGAEALPYVQGIFDDLLKNIVDSDNRFISKVQQELGVSKDTTIVEAFNPKTEELGYYPKESLPEGVIPLGPLGPLSSQSDEEYFTSSELEFGSHKHLLLHKEIVNFLGKFGQESDTNRDKVIKFLAEFMKYNSHGVLNDYVRVYEDLGIENSIPILLGNLKDENVLKRRMSAEILFRLEIGKVVASEKGVEYLGKLYDLGKYNDPDFFVRRLNSSGLMAVLGEEGGNIEGVFPLNLYADGDVIQSEVRQLISQELFLSRSDETAQQRKQREHYLQLFIENYESIFNDDIFEDTGVRLNSLDLHEQGWFLLNYIELSEQEDLKGLEKLRNFISEYGEYGLKSFLALEYGGSGQEILDFAEDTELTKEEKLSIFKNFYGIANEALTWRELFGNIETGLGYEFAPQVHEAFIRKNAEFFKAAQIIARGEGGQVTIGELLESMNTITFALKALKGIYEEESILRLEQKPNTNDEYDIYKNLVESASSSFILLDDSIGARIVVTIRPQPTIRQGSNTGGEARINFSVTNLATNKRARIGFDLSDYGDSIGEAYKPAVVSLDMGVGKPDKEAGIWPSQRVGNVLELVEGSEGGHNELSFKPEVAEYFPEVAARFRSYVKNKFVEQT